MSSLLDFAALQHITVLQNEPMSRHTTFRIGGPAEYYIAPPDEMKLKSILDYCMENAVPFLALGNGSNLLVSDKGIKGAVIATSDLNSVEIKGVDIFCGPGVTLSHLCRVATQAGLQGLEFAYGIPGSVGGAVYMNAGAYGGEMKDVVVSARHIGRQGAGEYTGESLCFGYRKSAYTGSHQLITSVHFRLQPGNKEEITEKMNAILQRRIDRQPLEYPSAGSVFKRPEGNYAGTLIEKCGLKGCKVGGAMVSEKHAGFIINVGDATCCDVQSLIGEIQSEVLRQTGITLECEIKSVG